jgi:hypothetical protein
MVIANMMIKKLLLSLLALGIAKYFASSQINKDPKVK